LASDRIFEPVESESVIRVEFNPQTLQTLQPPSKLAYVYIDSLWSVLVKQFDSAKVPTRTLADKKRAAGSRGARLPRR